MKKILILSMLLVLFISISAVSAEGNFTSLQNEIDTSTDSIDLTQDYVYDNTTDYNLSGGIIVNKDNFVINGNGYTVNGANLARLFNITGKNVTINNLILTNGNSSDCSAICSYADLTINNATFANNYATGQGGAIGSKKGTNLNINNSRFIDNYCDSGPSIYFENGNLILCNTNITSKISTKRGQILIKKGSAYLENVNFINISSTYASALFATECKSISIYNSKFINLTANMTAGAIGIRTGGEYHIENCEFINTTSVKNAGAIFIDIAGDKGLSGNVTIINTIFKNASSEFGGAYMQLCGNLSLDNTNFTDNHATYNGGAVYISYVEHAEINDCIFDSNKVDVIEGYPTYGGALFADASTLVINDSEFTNNLASEGNAIYTYDSSYTISNSIFENNTNAIYTVFDKDSNLENNIYNGDNVSQNNTYYVDVVIGEGMEITLLDNVINVNTLPSRFDLRDWGWVSSVKNQGWMGACWTFGMTGALESALLKATGIEYELSENNMQNTMLIYSIYGFNIIEGGMNIVSAGYLLSWLGAFTQAADTYDELGKISPVITTNQDIHVQDLMFIPNNEIPDGTQLKLAILKYGSLDISYNGQSTYSETTPYYNPETCAQYVDVDIEPNHAVSIVGWDDNFPKEKFGITPPGDGAWIAKNSWGTNFGEDGFLYVSYYDKTLLKSREISEYATSIILENTIPYNKNYQHETLWGDGFQYGTNGTISYMNIFESIDNDLIAAVGTYFNQSGMNYTVKIYVNDELKLTQEGVSPYLGYHTIQLDEYIPVYEGDVFKAVVTSNSMPFTKTKDARLHSKENISFISYDGENWEDAYKKGLVPCLKVYTVADPREGMSFTALENEIASATENYLLLSHDYEFYNMTDNNTGIAITRDNFVIDGNGYIIDGKNLSRIFNITANNVTLMNLVLINGNSLNKSGGAIYTEGTINLDNVTFINNTAKDNGGAIRIKGNITVNCNNSIFVDNYASQGSSIINEKGVLNLYNSYISSKIFNKYSQIVSLEGSVVYIDNVTFANSNSSYSSALYLRGAKAKIINSTFVNLTANLSAGAISMRNGGETYIENCRFINITSTKNGGAIVADVTGEIGADGNVIIIDTIFTNTSSGFGGAYLQLGGKLIMNNTEFTNAHATYNGGAVYMSYANAEINNCTFDSNGVDTIEGYPTYGGAIFFDMAELKVNDSKFTNNYASAGNAIYTYDTTFDIADSTFENNTNAIYTVFDKECNIDGSNVFNNDTISTNNTYYATIIVGQGKELELKKNVFNVTTLPSRFDLRDWGWISSVKDQGWMGACWTFGMTGALESALLKATGIYTDFSEKNMQATMLRYSIYGITELFEGAYNAAGTSYLLSWLGAFPLDLDVYDEVGKISPVMTSLDDIHVQDVIFVPNHEIPNGTQLKLAILKYGSLDVSYFGQSTYNEANPYYNPETYGQYVDEFVNANHEVSVIGWDDNYPKENFLITPPGDGAWIIKNSWGPDWGDEGCLYVSYYDKSLLSYTSTSLTDYAVGIIFENTVPYNKNYQYDMAWITNFATVNKTASYMNVYESLGDDLIAAVGTYFNQSGVNYTVEIFVNDELKLTQEGVSPYLGYHTIQLDQYIPIKAGDIFKAKITSNTMPYILLEDTRVHYTENISFASVDGGTWEDCYLNKLIACLKVYTVESPIHTEDLVKIYKNESQFQINTGVANETVNFEINGRNYTRVTDENGTATMNINLGPGNYTIKTHYDGLVFENNIEVLPTLIGNDLVKYYRNESQFYVSLIDGAGNPVSGTNITMNINGVFYTKTTNENGTAKLNINLPPGEYILTAIDPLTGLMMSYNITVLPTLTAEDLNMTYLDGSKFKVKLVDGQGRALANKTIKLNINGVIYSKTTNSSGIAELNIRLPSGEYIITSEYENARISNTITINEKED